MQSSLADKEQACADSGNQYPFCSPVSSDVWVNGTTHDFVWNFNYPFYVGYDQISLYLYYIIKYEYVSVKNFTNLDRSTGGLEVTVDDSWFLNQLTPGSSPQNLTIAGFYLPSNFSPYAEISSPISMFPRPFNFTVTQLALPGNGTNHNGTNSNKNSPNGNSNSSNGNSNNNNNIASSFSANNLPGWAIAVIVIAVIAFICGATALIYTMIISRRNKHNNKLLPASANNSNNNNSRSFGNMVAITPSSKNKGYNESINSQTKVTAFRSTDSVPMSTTGENASSIGTSLTYHNNTNNITSSEAVLLADQFRNTLGRSSVNKDWNSSEHIVDGGGGIEVEGEEEAELKRKRLGEALLQRQLEEDGTSVKHAGRFTRVKSLADIPKSAAVFEHPTN